VEPVSRVGRVSIYRGEAHRTSPGDRWASRCNASFDPPFYEKRRAVKLVFALFSRASFSFPLAAICIFSPSQQKRVGKPLRAHFSRDFSSFPLEAFFRFVSFRKGRAVKPVGACFLSGICLLSLSRLSSSFATRVTTSPSPRPSSVLSSGVPLGLVVHPSMAVSTHRRVRRPMMVWERGSRFYESWVRCRPKWVGCSSPRGST
jgi:hypothetical protein